MSEEVGDVLEEMAERVVVMEDRVSAARTLDTGTLVILISVMSAELEIMVPDALELEKCGDLDVDDELLVSLVKRYAACRSGICDELNRRIPLEGA